MFKLLFIILFQVALLRDILKTWRDELQKKPVNMSYEEALSELGLDPALLNS